MLNFKWKIFSNFVAFSEYPNFMYIEFYLVSQILLYFKSVKSNFEQNLFKTRNLKSILSLIYKLFSFPFRYITNFTGLNAVCICYSFMVGKRCRFRSILSAKYIAPPIASKRLNPRPQWPFFFKIVQ